jgi:ABC-2 type transport system permease protein
LLAGLVRKDLKVKYQGSVLGFVWSLANPLLLLVVYTFVFQVVLKSGIPQFGFYLLAGCWCGTRSPARSAPPPAPWWATPGW